MGLQPDRKSMNDVVNVIVFEMHPETREKCIEIVNVAKKNIWKDEVKGLCSQLGIGGFTHHHNFNYPMSSRVPAELLENYKEQLTYLGDVLENFQNQEENRFRKISDSFFDWRTAEDKEETKKFLHDLVFKDSPKRTYP